MIIKGKSRANAGQLAAYLLTQGDNEKVNFLAADNVADNSTLRAALLEMQDLAALTNCEKFLYHASINPKEGEKLDGKGWAKAVRELEKNLDLKGHQRAIVQHVKDGREHMHVVWSRIDPEKLKAKRMGWNYIQHEKTARQIERDLGLDRVQGVHVEKGHGPQPDRGPKQWEADQTRRRGLPAHIVKGQVSDLWQQSDNGQSFRAALHEQGYMLAQGDRKPFVIIDERGGLHGVSRRAGVKAAAVKEKLADLDPSQLPTVEQAKEMQADRMKQRESLKTAESYENQGMAAQQRAAMQDMAKRTRDREKRAAQGNTPRRGKKDFRKKNKGRRSELQEQAQKQQKRERQAKRSHEQEKQFRGGGSKARRPKAAGDIAREQQDARREMTDSQRRKKQADRMKEFFDRKFAGSPERANNAYNRERTRER